MPMPVMCRCTLALTASLALCGSALARDYARQAEDAANANEAALTLFVDVDWGGREDGAARELTRAHRAFAAKGFDVVGVEGYTENGDLEGFFVTYRRR